MIKVSKNEFNLFAFIIKTAVILFSIVVSLALFYFFEQKGMVVQVQTVQVRAEATTTNFNFSFNGKEFERFLSALMPAFLITRKVFWAFIKFFAFFYAGIILIACFILRFATKNIQNDNAEYSIQSNYDIVENNSIYSYDTVKNLNLTLTI